MSTSGKPAPGEARSPGISVQELLDREKVPVPEVLRRTRYDYMGSEPIPAERYTSRQFHELEMEKMWPRVWQMVCREEDITEVGDHIVYEIGDWSFLVMRSEPDRIKAFYNACLHRGRQLRTQSGNVSKLRCPFHGFTWDLDGSLQDVPCRWDFENRYKRAHVGKIVDMNWKVGVEAFIIFRFRPWRGPDRALMEVMYLSPCPQDKPRPKPAKMRLLAPDEDWLEALDELGPVAAIFHQDMANMPIVQRGLKSMKAPRLTIANYQESRIRHLHRTLEKYVYGVKIEQA